MACAGAAGIELQPFTHNLQYAGGGGFVMCSENAGQCKTLAICACNYPLGYGVSTTYQTDPSNIHKELDKT